MFLTTEIVSTRKKKPDIYERQKSRRLDARSRAETLKKRFPQLSRLKIDMSFEDYEEEKDSPSPKQEEYGPDSKAFFELKCPYTECIDGGFKLSAAVSEMVTKNETEASGTIVCHGWQDRERFRQYQCQLKMNYKITATY